jgi:hypothetical protein
MEIDILDALLGKENAIIEHEAKELAMPKRCSTCKCAPICSFLPTFINISKYGIYLGVEECHFYSQETKTESTKKG